jgi:hypothetical protein
MTADAIAAEADNSASNAVKTGVVGAALVVLSVLAL